MAYTSGVRQPNLELRAMVAAGSGREYLNGHPEWVEFRYLSKRTDWHGEREFCIVVVEREPSGKYLYIPIAGAMTAIVVGHRLSDAYAPCVWSACERLGIKSFRFLYLPEPALTTYDAPPKPPSRVAPR